MLIVGAIGSAVNPLFYKPFKRDLRIFPRFLQFGLTGGSYPGCVSSTDDFYMMECFFFGCQLSGEDGAGDEWNTDFFCAILMEGIDPVN